MQDQFASLFLQHSLSENIPKEPPKKPKTQNLSNLHKFTNNEWLRKHGKGDFIDFNSKQRARIRAVFKQLDKDGSGTLGVDELYEPLLALGLVENKSQVKEMMKRVDTNQSGLIEFDEFIKIIKQSSGVNNTLVNFFKNLSNDRVSEMKDLPFNLMLSNKRRELMLQGFLSKNTSAREQGQKILNAFAEELKSGKEDVSKQEKLKVKKEFDMKKMFERQTIIKTAVKGVRDSKSVRAECRPSTASKRPMTRRLILNLV